MIKIRIRFMPLARYPIGMKFECTSLAFLGELLGPPIAGQAAVARRLASEEFVHARTCMM
jgi:hypothetical protein